MRKLIVEPEFQEEPLIQDHLQKGIIGRSSWCLRGEYSITDEAIARGLEDEHRKLYQRRISEWTSDQLEKLVIEHIESSEGMFVSRHATKKTIIVSPKDYIQLRRQEPIRIAKAINYGSTWINLEPGEKLFSEMMDAVMDLFSRNYGSSGRLTILVPPEKLAGEDEEKLRVFREMSGSKLCTVLGMYDLYIINGIDRIIAVEGRDKK